MFHPFDTREPEPGSHSVTRAFRVDRIPAVLPDEWLHVICGACGEQTDPLAVGFSVVSSGEDSANLGPSVP